MFQKGSMFATEFQQLQFFLQFQVQSALSFSSMKWKADLMAIPETNILALKMGYTINMLYYRVITHLLTNLLLSL